MVQIRADGKVHTGDYGSSRNDQEGEDGRSVGRMAGSDGGR